MGAGTSRVDADEGWDEEDLTGAVGGDAASRVERWEDAQDGVKVDVDVRAPIGDDGRFHRWEANGGGKDEGTSVATTTTTTTDEALVTPRGRMDSRREAVWGDARALKWSLKVLCASKGSTPDGDDVFWYELGNAMSEPMTAVSDRMLDELLRPYGEALYANNSTSGGLYKLARHAARQLKVASASAHSTPLSAINVTVLMGTFLKYFMEFASAPTAAAHAPKRAERLRAFNDLCERNEQWETASSASSTSPFDDLLGACVDILWKQRVTSSTMALHLACVRLLLVASSSQLAYALDDEEDGDAQHPLAQRLARLVSEDRSGRAGKLVCALLREVMKREANSGDIYESAASVNEQVEHVTRGVAKMLSSFFSVRKNAVRTDSNSIACIRKAVLDPSPLADECANLILALCSHGALGDADANPFRVALKHLKDVSSRGSVPSNKRDATLINFEQLLSTLTASVSGDAGLLLTYTLLVSSSRFRAHVCSTSKSVKLTQVLLRDLYETNMPHVSQLITTILLILSEDTQFNRRLQKVSSGPTGWYKERILQKTSLSSLFIIVLSRTIKYTTASSSAVGRTLNALGAIANTSCVTRDISGYAAQRLVNILALFTRRYSRAAATVKNGDVEARERHYELEVCEDFLRVIFEILNSLATDMDSLHNNPEIVYALMHQQQLLEAYRTHAAFAEYVQNIENVLDHYNSAVDMARRSEADSPMSVGRLKTVIAENALSTSPVKDKLDDKDCSIFDFHPMRFSYAEDAFSTPYFIIPYAWAVIHSQTGVFWRDSTVRLFSTRAVDAADDDYENESESASLQSSMSEAGGADDANV